MLNKNYHLRVIFSRNDMIITFYFIPGEPLHIDMELALASFDSISEVNMVSYFFSLKRNSFQRVYRCMEK